MRGWDRMGVRPRARPAKIAGRTHTSHWRSPLISFVIRRFRNTLSSPASTLGDTLLDQYIEALDRIRAEVIHSYLSSVQLLSRRLIETARSLTSVRVVETSSETFLVPQPAMVRRRFGWTPSMDMAGAMEPFAWSGGTVGACRSCKTRGSSRLWTSKNWQQHPVRPARSL